MEKVGDVIVMVAMLHSSQIIGVLVRRLTRAAGDRTEGIGLWLEKRSAERKSTAIW
jgi:hypothetical protein